MDKVTRSLIIFYLDDDRNPIVGLILKPHTPDFYRIFDREMQRPSKARLFKSEVEFISNITNWIDFMDKSQDLSDEHGVKMYEDTNDNIDAWNQWRANYKFKIIDQTWRPPVFRKYKCELNDLLATWERNMECKLVDDPEVIISEGPIWIHQLPRQLELANCNLEWVPLADIVNGSVVLDERFVSHYKRFRRWIRTYMAEERLMTKIYESPPPSPPQNYQTNNPFALLQQ